MFMIAGPNGAGKSTLYKTRIQPSLPRVPFINADLIQRDELRDPSMQASYKAAEIAEQRRQKHITDRSSFVSESTFSHASKLALVDHAQKAGFRVVMYHVHLRSPELSVKRVAFRHREGGHNVPEEKVRERYARNPALIREAVLKADRAFVYDNSTFGQPPHLALELQRGQVVFASDRVPAWARETYAKELGRFSPARLNQAAASFADLKVIAQRLGGQDIHLRVAVNKKGNAYEGQLVGESDMHWLQQVQPDVYVAHYKTAFQEEMLLHGNYRVQYGVGGRGAAAAVEKVVPDRPPRAQAFERESPEIALKKYPELEGAFASLKAAVLHAQTFKTKAQSAMFLERARQVIQQRLDAGKLVPKPQTKVRETGNER